MKKLLFLLFMVVATVSCNYSGTKVAEADKMAEPAIVNIEDLFTNTHEFVDDTISLKGLCIHVCKHGGKKMFLQGIDENQLVKVFAEGEITAFEQELVGSHVVVTGLLTAAEVNDHEPEGGEGHTCETESKSKSYELSSTSFKIVNE